MNMRRNGATKPRSLGVITTRVLHTGLFLIYGSLFRLLVEVQAAAPFTAGAAARFGLWLEHPVAALALLTGGVLLLWRVEKESE